MRNPLPLIFLPFALAVEMPAQRRFTLYDFDTLKTFRCDFTESEGRRTSAQGTTTPAKQETFSDLVVDAIDYRGNTARFIGNAGSDTVRVIDGGFQPMSTVEEGAEAMPTTPEQFGEAAALVDPARLRDYSKYTGATALKLNLPEARGTTGEQNYEAAAATLLGKLELEAVVITLNDDGAYLATSDGECALLSSRPRQVADATGAGDTVLAVLCMARAAGASGSRTCGTPPSAAGRA